MGFFDARCMVTGVSLKGSRSALVLLQQHQAAHHPIALAITGQYDRLGSIDGIDEDENTEIVFRYFSDQHAASAFVVHEKARPDLPRPSFATIEQLLHSFERCMNDGPPVTLGGQRVVFALIAEVVWEAIAQAAPRPARRGRDELLQLLHQSFAGSPIAVQMYEERLEDVARPLSEFAAISNLLVERRLPWRPTPSDGQHYTDEMQQYLQQARSMFHDSPTILKGLEAYEREVGDLLEYS